MAARDTASAAISTRAARNGPERQEARERRDAEEDREDEGGDPEGADPAVVHDLELPGGGGAAAEAVDRVGEAVLVQAAGEDHRREHREGRGDEGRDVQPDGDHQNGAARHADQRADQREDSRRPPEVGFRTGGRPEPFRGQPRQEAGRRPEVVEDRFGLAPQHWLLRRHARSATRPLAAVPPGVIEPPLHSAKNCGRPT